MKRFRARRGGGAVAVLEQSEARLLANLVAQVAELLSERAPAQTRDEDPLSELVDLDGPVDVPDDPVLRRLLPAAYRQDDDAAADFRRYTERGLVEAKLGHARRVIESLRAGGLTDDEAAPGGDDRVEVDLDAAGVQAWLRSLTDVRLALAERLGITDDEHQWPPSDVDPSSEDDPVAVMHDVYDWLGFVQETLVVALDR